MKTEIFEKMIEHGYEQITFFYDKETGLKAINAIHSTALGPAMGGTRFLNYATEDEALEDVLRLSRSMTYKNAGAGLNVGGGKCVIIGDPAELRKDPIKTEAFFRKYGRFVAGLAGRYRPGVDMNTSEQDMEYVAMETRYAMSTPGKSGDVHFSTALGVFRGIEACCMHVYGERSVAGRTVAIQGLGLCGYLIAKLLHEAGARLIVTDIDPEKVAAAVETFQAQAVSPDEIYDVDCDIYCPCARGGTVNRQTIERLKCRIICGAANNTLLEEEKDGRALMEKGIVFAPDFIVSAGGAISDVICNFSGTQDMNRVSREDDKIYDRLLNILRSSEESGKTPCQAAYDMIEKRIETMRRVDTLYRGEG